MSRSQLHRYLLSRRRFLAHAARVSGASLASIPLIGCADDEDSSSGPTMDAGTDAQTAMDAGTDPAMDTETMGDAGTDAMDVTPESPWFRFAVVADTHIIDEWYEGPESNELDTESMFFTEERYIAARDFLMGLDPAPEFICHVGDFIHDYPSLDVDFFFDNETRLDTAIGITDGFGVPFHMCLGNHDYEFRDVPRSETHALFREKMGMEPYHSFEHRGWRFVFLDTYSGETHNPDGDIFLEGENGSLGEEQLQWLEALLADEKPTFIFLHQMLPIMQPNEVADLDIQTLMARHEESIQFVIAGHTHRWLDLGTQYGPGHMVMGATRYDEDCFVVVDVNTETGEFVFANQDTWQTLQPFADTWEV